MESQQLLLTVQEAAESLRVGRSTIYELFDTGKLRSVQIGRSRRVPLEALAEYVAQLAEGEK